MNLYLLKQSEKKSDPVSPTNHQSSVTIKSGDDSIANSSGQSRIKNKLYLGESEHLFHQMANKIINYQEYERQRLSSDLHDGIGQILSALKFQVESILIDSKSVSSKRKCDPVISSVLENITTALVDLRKLSSDMRSSIIDDNGLLIAIQSLVSKYRKIYLFQNVDLQVNATESDIPQNIKIVIYRIIQESLNNVAKHSNADNVLVKLRKSGGGVYLRITDDGCGFDVNNRNKKKKSGIGLNSMQERAVDSGAVYSINSDVLSGTSIQVFWKLD